MKKLFALALSVALCGAASIAPATASVRVNHNQVTNSCGDKAAKGGSKSTASKGKKKNCGNCSKGPKTS